MLPANLISTLQALSASGKPLITATSDTPNLVTKIEPGQQVQGSVQSKISEGLYKVQVAGQMLQMRLPGNIQSGDVINLQVITVQPRITFSMAASTNPLATSEQIGATARMLANLAELPLERQIVQQPGNKAVWQAEQIVPDTKFLAGTLRDALGKSGLFYESHQAQWVQGKRSINQLLEEPQNLLTAKNVLARTEGIAQAGDAAQPIAKELLHLVQQQLHTLEHHHLIWMGQIWPDQMMQWEIQGESEQQRQQPDERLWSTEVALTLPHLGEVQAHLMFSANGLRLTLHAADPATLDMFNHALPQLKNSIADAGIDLIAAAVEQT